MITRRTLTEAALLASTGAGAAWAPAWAEEGFAAFLAGVRAEASEAGVSAATLDRALGGLRPNPKVLELDRAAPERTQSWQRYRAVRITPPRVAAARRELRGNAATLNAVRRRWGVDPAVIVAIWGLESDFGGFTGGFSVLEALATLAAAGRHDGYFRGELLGALRILDGGDVAPARMTGSYAGAMGQPQFMPTSYLAYAVDFDGDGRRDIWDSRPDVLASVANYLAASGWRAGEPWGEPVLLPTGLVPGGREDRRALGAWAALGVRRADGSRFAREDAPGAVVLPDGPGGEAFMTYANFGVIRLYNASDLYALSVGVLADAAGSS